MDGESSQVYMHLTSDAVQSLAASEKDCLNLLPTLGHSSLESAGDEARG